MQTITYDTASGGVRPVLLGSSSSISFCSSVPSARLADVTSCRPTFVYGYGYDRQGTPRPPLLPGSSLGPVLAEIDLLLTDPRTGWHDFWSLLIAHSACERLWRSSAERALIRTHSPIEWSDEIVSAASLRLGLQLEASRDVRGSMAAMRDHFETWLSAILANRCLEAVRIRRHEELELRGRHKLKRCYPRSDRGVSDGLLCDEAAIQVNDLDSLPGRAESGTDWQFDLEVLLAPFPERTRQVLILRSQEATWPEVAATLGVTVRQATWSLVAYQRELYEVLSTYR